MAHAVKENVMPNLRLECDSCEAVFNVKHDNDPVYYTLQHCPFCGEDVSDDNQDEVQDPEE
jgi:hypothetical protein